MTLEGSSEPSMFLRVARTLAYICIGTAGLLLLLSPVFRADSNLVTLAMTWFFLVGGGLAATGAGTGRWFGEFTGLPLITVSFAVFGILTWRANVGAAPFIAWANLMLLVGLSLMFLARWRYVFSVVQAALNLSPGRRSKR